VGLGLGGGGWGFRGIGGGGGRVGESMIRRGENKGKFDVPLFGIRMVIIDPCSFSQAGEITSYTIDERSLFGLGN